MTCGPVKIAVVVGLAILLIASLALPLRDSRSKEYIRVSLGHVEGPSLLEPSVQVASKGADLGWGTSRPDTAAAMTSYADRLRRPLPTGPP